MSITKRSENYSEWYLDVIREAKLADYSPVKGCMVIRPDGYSIWEITQKALDRRFRETGHRNAYFPLFIPKSFFSREAEHVEGFAKECAVVTHYRLKNDTETNSVVVDEDARLTEELVVRPTSETIIWSMYKKWIRSHRDLPILLNQWANVVRWEMRTRLFLRTAEFLWQEGHTAHATSGEASEEVYRMLDVYREFAEQEMAIPVYRGQKTESEKFAGAIFTMTIEGMMQDGRALQMGTSHHLGQNFAKAFDVKFMDKDGIEKYVWATSWGVSTRLIGALIMTHSDDKGLVLPPRMAETKVVIVPIFKGSDNARIKEYSQKICTMLVAADIPTIFDDRDEQRAGFKFAEWERQGIPLRFEIGEKEVINNTVIMVRRDTGEKMTIPLVSLSELVSEELTKMQTALFERAKQFRDDNTIELDSWEKVEDLMRNGRGFAKVFWNGTTEQEALLKSFQASVRCILPEQDKKGRCIVSGGETNRQVIIARSY